VETGVLNYPKSLKNQAGRIRWRVGGNGVDERDVDAFVGQVEIFCGGSLLKIFSPFEISNR